MKQPKASFILGKVSTTKDCVMGIFLLLLFVRVVCLVVPASFNMYMYYGRRLVSTGFQSCSEIFQPFLGNCWKYLIDSSVYSCVLHAIFNIFTRIFVFWILKKYKSWLLFSRDLSMYTCNMINRCAPHEKKKRRNQEKNGNSRRSTLSFSPYRNSEGYKFRKVMGDTC